MLPSTSNITRRRALELALAAGVGSLVRHQPPAMAADGSSFTMPVPAGAVSSARVISAPRRFDLVGVRGAGLAGSGLELRVRASGGPWSKWAAVGPGIDHAPDRPRRTPASDPVWAGGADELQLRSRRSLGPLSLAFVAAPPAVARARAAQAQALTPAPGAPAILPRAAWGGDTLKTKAAPSYGAIALAFVHHTESANDYAPADSARIVLSIARYHMDHNGWNDIGYNFLVDRYGQVFEGRAGGIEQAVIGAHAGGWNSQSTGIANIGGYVSAKLPPGAEDVLARLIAWKLALHGVPLSGAVELVSGGGSFNRYAYGTKVTLNRVSGHRDGCKTDCPGAALYGQLPDLRTRVAALDGKFAAKPAAPPVAVTITAPKAGARVVAPGRMAVRGTIAPSGNVAIVVERQLADGRWARTARIVAKPTGRRFAATIRLTKPGVYRLSARGGTAGHATATPRVYVRAVKDAKNLNGARAAQTIAGPGGPAAV